MKISELIEKLTQAKKQYGDLPVETITGADFARVYYGEINNVEIVANRSEQYLSIGETLDENMNVRVRLHRIFETEDDE